MQLPKKIKNASGKILGYESVEDGEFFGGHQGHLRAKLHDYILRKKRKEEELKLKEKNVV